MLRHAVPGRRRQAGIDPGQVIGIGTDFTACTVLPVLADGTPLCEFAELAGRPHAYAKLWKHHAAQPQADRINELAHDRGEPWIARYGGKISSEWQFAKALQLLEEDPDIYRLAERWIEAADWIIWQLTGAETRNACTAGYKGIFQDGRYPSREFLAAPEPRVRRLRRRQAGAPRAAARQPRGLADRAARRAGPACQRASRSRSATSTRTSPRRPRTPLAPGQMIAIMGTSTCHVMNGETLAEVPGMCGVVDGGIVAGRWGYEAGQSGVGDIFAWFAEHAVPPECHAEAAAPRHRPARAAVAEQAARQPAGRARPDRAGLAERQPQRARRPPPVRRHRRPDAGHPAARHLPGAARVDRVRHPGHHRRVRGRGRAGHAS